MTKTTAEKRAAFRSYHAQGCFVIPNPWDVGSARMLQHLGFRALASTSTGFAWSTGRPDYEMKRDDVLNHLTALCASVDVPINADFETGFAADPEGVAANVALAIEAGVAGLSIEDRDIDNIATLYDTPRTVDRIKAAKQRIVQSGADVILVGRTEGLLIDPNAIHIAIDKLVAIAEAGADCVFAPGIAKREDISALVRAVSPTPVNVVVMKPGLSVGDLADLGVRRISLGGALARVAWGALLRAADQIKTGSFDLLGEGMSGAELNKIFSSFA